MPDAIWAVSRLPPDLSRSPGPAPVSTPLRKLTTRQQRFAFARLPDPHLTRSSPRLFRSAHHERHLTDAACGGLRPPPAGRPRRTYLHLLHSTASSGSYIEPSFSVRGTRPGVFTLSCASGPAAAGRWLLDGCSFARIVHTGRRRGRARVAIGGLSPPTRNAAHYPPGGHQGCGHPACQCREPSRTGRGTAGSGTAHRRSAAGPGSRAAGRAGHGHRGGR